MLQLKFFKTNSFFWGSLLTSSMIVFIASFHPSNQWLRTFLLKERSEPEILGLLDVSIDFPAPQPLIMNHIVKSFTVLKTKQMGKIIIQFFQKDSQGWERQLGPNHELREGRDGYMEWQGKTQNLIASDLDGNGVPEVLAPTFDVNGVPRLHIFSFNKENGTFQLVPAEQYALTH